MPNTTITIKKPSALEMFDLRALLMQSNSAAANPISAEHLQEILQLLDEIAHISLDGLRGEELEAAKQNIINLKYRFCSNLIMRMYSVCSEHVGTVIKTLYNKYELSEFRPNFSLAEDRYRGSLLACILNAALDKHMGPRPWEIKLSDHFSNEAFNSGHVPVELTREIILHGDDVAYALFALCCVRSDFTTNKKYYDYLLIKLFPSIDGEKAAFEATALGLRKGYFSDRLFVISHRFTRDMMGDVYSYVDPFVPQIPIIVAGKRYNLTNYITDLEPIDEPGVSNYIALAEDESRVDLRTVQFDYKYAVELRKALSKSNLFKFIFENMNARSQPYMKWSELALNNFGLLSVYGGYNVICLLSTYIPNAEVLRHMLIIAGLWKTQKSCNQYALQADFSAYPAVRFQTKFHTDDPAMYFQEKFHRQWGEILHYAFITYSCLTAYHLLNKFGVPYVMDNTEEHSWLNSLPNAYSVPYFDPNDWTIDSMLVASYITSYLVCSLASTLGTANKKADLKNIAIEPDNMALSPILHRNMLEDKRVQQSKALTVCFDKFAKERRQKSVASENGIIEKIMDYSIGERLPNALSHAPKF